MYILSLPGTRRPTYRYALATWNLHRSDFDAEVDYAYSYIFYVMASSVFLIWNWNDGLATIESRPIGAPGRLRRPILEITQQSIMKQR